ncbi:MAG: hypothetical protein JG764_1229 [Clostridiales bacterium]|jgi:hypothetical protein|nr:hypothetical protein [Clostridiales bacterium]
MQKRVVEAYIGEYASGKSENAVNRALELAREGEKVVLADLDLVEPFYTLRPIKKLLEEKNIEVIAWETQQVMGLGEAGSVLKPEMRWVLKKEGNIILDIGYGVEGAKVLNLLEGFQDNPHLKIYVVVNIARPATATVRDIVDYVQKLGNVDGLINNTHVGDDTDVKTIQEGARVVTAAAKELNLPVIHTTAEKRLQGELGVSDICGNPVRYIDRYMPQTFW